MSSIASFELSLRQISILEHIIKGHRNHEIAESLGISPRTVEDHRSKMLKKTNSNNITQLTILAIKKGYISLYNN